jgi:hypothetical protein
MTDTDLLAVCGLYCGACYHYRASFPDGKHLLNPEFRGNRPLQGYTCRGCRSDKLYIHPGCAECQIRDCAEGRGIVHCGECERSANPHALCQRLKAFQTDGRAHHIPILQQLEDVQRRGIGQWLAEQKERWTCACGQPFSWYERVCRRCGKSLHSYANQDDCPPMPDT